MSSRCMAELEVTTEGGNVILRQFNYRFEAEEGRSSEIQLSPDQIPLVIQWMRDAAGLSSSQSSGGSRKPEEIERMAALFRRLAPAIAGGPQDRASAADSMSATLQWAAGYSDVPPDAWLLDSDDSTEE